MPTSIKSPPDDSVLNLWSMSEFFGGGEWGGVAYGNRIHKSAGS